MRLRDLPTSELQRILDATKKVAGPESIEVAILRREIERRETVIRAHDCEAD